MKQIVYLGPLGGVQLADGTQLDRGAAVQVPDEIADELTGTRPEEFRLASADKS